MNPLPPSNSANDPLSVAWTSQQPSKTLEPAALAKSAADAHRRDQMRLIKVNVQELLPPLLLAALIASNIPDASRPALLIVGAVLAAGVSFFLLGSSILHARADRRWGSSIREQLSRRSAQLNHRVWMYRNLAWWYFIPLAVAFGLFVYGGGDIPLGEGLLILGLITAVLGAIYVFARRIGKHRYEDEADRFNLLLADFAEAA